MNNKSDVRREITLSNKYLSSQTLSAAANFVNQVNTHEPSHRCLCILRHGSVDNHPSDRNLPYFSNIS